MLIRAGQAWEAEEIALVHAQAHWSAYAPLFGAQAKPLDAAQQASRWQAAFLGNDLILVAVDDARIVGVGHASGVVLDKLYLLGSHRRRGLGAQMFSALLEAMRSRGVAVARFNVLAMNQAARRFYEAQGARLTRLVTVTDALGEVEDAVYEIDTERPA